MKIIVGLGNPGEKYKLNRHNVGFQVIDKIAKEHAEAKWSKNFKGLYCLCRYQNQKFLVFKPETYMNYSGRAVDEIIRFYKIKPQDVTIIHDDLDLPVGQIKIKSSGGHAGHNGLRSVHQLIGDQYVRVRIGIGRPKEKTQVSSYVLSNFDTSELKQVESYKNSLLRGVDALINDDYGSLINIIKNESKQRLQSNNKTPAT